MVSIEELVEYVKSWIGYSYHSGQSAQCANFVRHCFEHFGINLPVEKKPDDYEYTKNEPQGSSYANSLCGNTIGDIVDMPHAGDIVFFSGTYGDYGKNVITHVGIMVSDSTFVHRPTAVRPVEEADITGAFWKNNLYKIRRPRAFAKDTHTRVKLFIKTHSTCFLVDGYESDIKFKLFCNGKKSTCVLENGQEFKDFECQLLCAEKPRGRSLFSVKGRPSDYRCGDDIVLPNYIEWRIASSGDGNITLYDAVSGAESRIVGGIIDIH